MTGRPVSPSRSLSVSSELSIDGAGYFVPSTAIERMA